MIKTVDDSLFELIGETYDPSKTKYDEIYVERLWKICENCGEKRKAKIYDILKDFDKDEIKNILCKLNFKSLEKLPNIFTPIGFSRLYEFYADNKNYRLYDLVTSAESFCLDYAVKDFVEKKHRLKNKKIKELRNYYEKKGTSGDFKSLKKANSLFFTLNWILGIVLFWEYVFVSK